MNPFGIIMAILNVVAACYEFVYNKNPKMGVTYLCYGVASVALALR